MKKKEKLNFRKERKVCKMSHPIYYKAATNIIINFTTVSQKMNRVACNPNIIIKRIGNDISHSPTYSGF